ncbi:hypothetical protein GCM10010168_40370 [Actinoplanes ianthinogenes]|uniref:Uncharacterized protein n=1 Tax=Actinoplanes ianthinogenes TaxID=122358 RepID=A0ABN6CH06_9ACTN|nr:hypothetical protein [Actinoplanes ianthinogenes]BCJ43654.1 hypothetical protein Aiant_43110 [Actinoplanes ianthinogenes]GGR18573.1 hypothetical protein GCM10010168_40370 [Actinoplanes ianthinogenes]
MPGWRVERTPRTASRSVPVTPGGSPLMPPHSQGAERRPERRAGRAGSRWVLRALVVGGLAGAAWLLTGAAAHAAGPGPEPITGSWFGAVTENVERATGHESVVGELLKAAVQPLESVPEIPQYDSSAEEPLDEVLPEAAAPLRASSEDADDEKQPVAEADKAESVAEPARPAVTRVVKVGKVKAGKAKASRSTRATSARTRYIPVRRLKAHSRSHLQRHAPAARPVAPETIREDVPGGDGPAPARTNLGAVSGIPAGSGSGGSPEGGSSAVPPSGIVNGPVACHRCPVAPDVDARRNDAEAPTVSPD